MPSKIAIQELPIDVANGRFTVDMPESARVLGVVLSNGKPCLTVMGNTGDPFRSRNFVAITQSVELSETEVVRAKFIGSMPVQSGQGYACHVFELA